jgi:signal transduction histidine kinase
MSEGAVTVSSVAAAGGAAALRRRSGDAPVPRRRLQAVIGLATIPLVLVAFGLPLAAGHMTYPAGLAFYSAYLVAAPVVVGLVWWRKHPATRFGPLLVAFGLAAWPLCWQAASNAFLYNLGAVADAPFLLLNFFLVLAFPTGRLETRFDKALMLTLGAAIVAFFAAELLLQPTLMGTGPLADCGGNCPENVFQVGSQPELLDALGRLVTYVGLTVVAAIVVVYVARVRRGSRPQRRNLVVVAGSSLLLLPALGIYYFALLVVGVEQSTGELLGWLVVAAQVVFPLGFALALLQADLFAGRARRRLLVELVRRPTPASWRTVVAEALDDPSLRLAFWDPQRRRFREAGGGDLDRPEPGSGRRWVDVARNGRPVAAMVTDEALTQNPELVDAALSATLLAVEHGHLEGALRAEQARAVLAGDLERRRIGRDLHDSAQQRLVALRVHLALARDRLERPGDRALVEELGEQLDEALAELQTVTHGLYPQHLARHGIAASLRSASLRSALAVEIRDEDIRRRPAAIELAVYFCCLEALQNAAKHAGAEASVTVRLWDEDDALRFEVADDGAGFDPARVTSGDGLANLAERLGAVGGTLDLDSAAGRGTRVAGTIPT